MWNKRASLEIGVNTIVILVIAMMLLGLGIGFVKGIFGKANDLPDLIEVDFQNPPTSSDPIKLTPNTLNIKSGDAKDITIGVYNAGQSTDPFDLSVSACTKGPGDEDILPLLEALPGTIQPGESAGFKVIIHAADADGNKMPGPHKYICKVTASQGTGTGQQTYDSQFTLTVGS